MATTNTGRGGEGERCQKQSTLNNNIGKRALRSGREEGQQRKGLQPVGLGVWFWDWGLGLTDGKIRQDLNKFQ